MYSQEEIIRRILNEYDEIRSGQEILRKKRIEEIYEKFPRLAEIHQEINRLGAENMRLIMQNPQKSQELNAEFSKKLSRLKKEREEILIKNGILEDFDQVQYRCKDCGDTGYIGNKKCHCFIQRMIDYAYKQSNFGETLKDKSFENFSFDFYSSRLIPGEEISEKDNMKYIYQICRDFCKNFDSEFKNLFMFGKPGLGKTYLSACVANEILNKQKTVLYLRATKLFSQYEDYRFGREKSDDFQKIIDRIYQSDLLILDDLGTENQTKSSVSFLFDILNERLDRNKKMIINSNFMISELSKIYSARFTSRIYESFHLLHFKGNDIRVQMLKK